MATGSNFLAVDAEIAISSFLEHLQALPSSIGIAIPGRASSPVKTSTEYPH